MKTSGNTILITGGGSGIGRGLAEAFHQLGNQVIIAGRGNKSLEETTAANPGMQSLRVDLTNAESTQAFAERVKSDFPSLNVLLHCAGIMQVENLLTGHNTQTSDATVATNLIAPIHLTEALLPLLQKQPHGTILTVTSGLAFVPLAFTPTYSATKAALHSYTLSLRYQLRKTGLQVIEIIPPYVATTLMGEHQATDPRAMPLPEYIAETMEILTSQPDANEVWVKRLFTLRFAAEAGAEKYDAFVQSFNDQMAAAHPQ